jgi:hypothetical protein
MHVAREGIFDGCVLQRCREDLAGSLAHKAELLAARWREIEHGGDYKIVKIIEERLPGGAPLLALFEKGPSRPSHQGIGKRQIARFNKTLSS